MPDDTQNTRLELSRRKILGATGIIGAASLGAGLGTSAFFSDREQFTNNQLTAGALDLKVSWEEHYSDWSEDEADHAHMEDGELVVDDRQGWMNATLQEQFPDKRTRRELETGEADPCTVLADVPDDLEQPVIDLTDVKPGDFGEITFDFALCDNPGFVWLTGGLRDASENGRTEPERQDPDEEDGVVELLDEVVVTIWHDRDCDNIVDEGEDVVFEGSLRNALTTLSAGNGLVLDADRASGGVDCYAPAPERHCVGVKWELPADHGNEVQSDAVRFDLGFYTEQCRHNSVQQAIRLEPIATGLTAPNWGTAVPGCLSDRLVVTDQDGILWAVNVATGDRTVLLDVSDRLVALGVGGPGTFDERGLLGVAFHPDYASNGLLYTYTSEPVSGGADFSTLPAGESPNHQSVLTEWQVPDPCNPDSVVDPSTRREVVRIDQPQFNHDAGCLVFGPDGQLYVGLGDGGAADDQGVGHVPGGNGQDPSNILGTILRIDPTGSTSTNGQYGIPADNPFVGTAGFLDEIYAYGFRNPFRFSFDSETGEMYIADVGQNDIEEIDIGVAGGNYGWPIKEGSQCFDPNGNEPGFAFECGPGDAPPGLIDPIAEYTHDEGIAIVGGFVYRGSELPSLTGRYVFGDFFHPPSGSGRLFHLDAANQIREVQLAMRDSLGLSVLGFGQDASGELYLLANETGTPFGDTGVVLRLTSP